MNSENNIRNAVIESAFLGKSEHGYLTITLTLDYGDSTQLFGDMPLYYKSWGPGKCWAGFVLEQIFEVVEVDSWEKLIGKFIRVRQSSKKVEAIGHITKEFWFSLESYEKKEKNMEASDEE